MCLQVWEENCAEIWKHFADVAQKKGTASLDIKLTALPLPFHNPHVVEQRFWRISLHCFHWDATRAVASLLGQRMRFLEQLLCFKRANRGRRVEYPFGTAPGDHL
jgi:hypothetical protein